MDKTNQTGQEENFPPVPIVIPDECGDSLWDAVLNQDKQRNAAAMLQQLAAVTKNQEDQPANQATPSSNPEP